MNELGKGLATLGVCAVAGIAVSSGHPVCAGIVILVGVGCIWG